MILLNSTWGLFDFFTLMGSLALFLYGMKIMSDGLQQAAGNGLRRFLEMMTSNTFKGLLTGIGITALIQSSSVTTVMLVSFVNSGLLSLQQAVGVIMGANIGTTTTAWVIDLLGFKANIGDYMLILLAIGTPFLFFKASQLKGLGNALIGFALLFMGLTFLQNSVPEIDENSSLVQLFTSLNDIPFFSTIIFVLFGAILTVVIQSSSATIALTMTMMVSGIITFEMGAAMVLGENVGTTITASIASLVGNVHARRTARIHALFNIIGVTWVIIIFPYFLELVAYITTSVGGGNPLTDAKLFGSTGLVVLHTTFNILNTSILIWFAPQLVSIAEKTVRSKGDRDEQYKLEYIGARQKIMPTISIMEAKKELIKFGDIAGRMSGFTRNLMVEEDKRVRKKILERIGKYEEITDVVEVEIADYLNKVLETNKETGMATRVSGMNKAASNLERIGDLFYKIALNIEKRNQEKISFSPLQEQRLHEIFDLIDQAFEIMNANLKEHSHLVTLDKAIAIEEKINKKRLEVRTEHYHKIPEHGDANFNAGLIYQNMFSTLERIGDHILNVSEGAVGKI